MSAPNPATLEALARHRTLGGAPREELMWLCAHGTMQSLPVGGITTRKGEAEQYLQILLSGRLAIHTDRGAGSRKIVEWRGGDVCGLMPYSRGASPPGDTVAEAPTETLAVHRDQRAAMIHACPTVTAMLVHAMLDRARFFTSSELHDEKLMALGKLAAGLAHELNNPASAATRSAQRLAEALSDLESAGRAREAARLSDAQVAVVERVRTQCAAPGPRAPHRSPLERADREDAIVSWLEDHEVDDALGAPLADAGVELTTLDELAGALDRAALEPVLRSVAASIAVRAIAADIAASTSRIHELVAAVKRFAYVDRAPVHEAVDVRRGLADTLLVLGGKTRAKSVETRLLVADGVPPARGVVAELNQVWANLIDNAIDAAASAGTVDVSAERVRDRVVVRVVDDGPGIAADIQGRIFDPFFTTKGVGEGTGLGLDIVRRIIQRHDGEIDVETRPGRTEFRVSLPMYA